MGWAPPELAAAGGEGGLMHMKSLVATLLLAGLAGSSTATELPNDIDGQRQLIVRCGTATMSACAKRATKECGGAYDVV
jgi:hypothetical protein